MAKFFATPRQWRGWLKKHHASKKVVHVGFHKVGSGRKSITWRQAVDEALCFGWIDGRRDRIDATSYQNRFTPRTPTSNWSTVNIRRYRQLARAGRVTTAGRAAFERRRRGRAAEITYERRHLARLRPEETRRFRARTKAWRFWRAQPPGYRRLALFYVVSAKKDETRRRRLARLIRDSAAGRRLGILA